MKTDFMLIATRILKHENSYISIQEFNPQEPELTLYNALYDTVIKTVDGEGQ